MSTISTTAQGNAFRDSIRQLLELTPGCTNVQSELQVGTQPVDIYYEERTSFGVLRVACECKDYGTRITKDLIAREIYPRYNPLLTNNLVDAIRIIAPLDVNATARNYVKECGFTFHTADQVSSQLIDFRQYMRGQISAFSEDGLDAYYVRPVTESGEDLEAMIQSWIDGESSRPVAILAGYGMGKTSFVRKLACLLAREALSDPAKRIPIFIPLSEISGEQDLEGLMGKLLAAQHRPPGYHFDLFLELNRRGRFVVILDGFNEMKHTISWSEFAHNFSQLCRLTTPKAKGILLGRPSALLSEDEELFVLRGKRREGNQIFTVEGAPDYQELRLRHFSSEQALDFIRRYATYRSEIDAALRGEVLSLADMEVRTAEIRSDPEMLALVGRPVQAKMLADLALDPAVQWRSFTRYTLYREFIRRISEREARKPSRAAFNQESRSSFLRRIAWWVWRRSSSSGFKVVEMPDTVLAGLPDLVEADIQSVKRDLIAGSLLEKKSAETYYFPHRSFTEFLVGEYMCVEGSPPSGMALADFAAALTPEIRDFIKESPHKDTVALWADNINDSETGLSAELLMLVGWSLNEIGEDMYERGTETASPREVMIQYFRTLTSSNTVSDGSNYLGRTFRAGRDIQSQLACILGMLHAQQIANEQLREGLQRQVSALVLGECLDELKRLVEQSGGTQVAVEKRKAFINLLISSFKAELNGGRVVLSINVPSLYESLQTELLPKWRISGFPFSVERSFAKIPLIELAKIDNRLSLTEKGSVAASFFRQFPDPAVLIPVLQKAKRDRRPSLSLRGSRHD